MTPVLCPVRRAVFASALAIVTAPLTAGPAEAQSFDMDCKVILCMAGGFPAGCADAYNYMIDRISRMPPLPPFGYCAMSDGSQYTAYTIYQQHLDSRSPSSWDCPAGLDLHFEDGDVFCYTHSTTRVRGDGIATTAYHGTEPARSVNYVIQITLEPGTAEEWVSPLYRLNYHTGYLSQS